MNMLDLTLKEAVEYLSHHEENYQQYGAIFIQHATFKEEHTKQEVRACTSTLINCKRLFLTCEHTPSKHALQCSIVTSLMSEECPVAVLQLLLCEDLCITCLEGKGGESIYHKIAWLLLLFVTTYNFYNPLTQFPPHACHRFCS